jgi:metal-responsive CopG/Arc/MetJ family transcriptional regulator
VFGGEKIKIDKNLLERAKKFASVAGYSSVDEFIAHLIEKELANLEGAGDDEEVKKRLKGLGYIS